MNDWKFREFEDCIERVTYTPKVQRKDFLDEGTFPIVSQEQDFINGYWNDANAVFNVTKPVVIFGDHTQVIKFVDFDFVLGADGVKILQPTDELYPRYFYRFLQSVELKSLGYARHYRLLKEVSVPIPPIAEQKRIVAILDEAFEAIDKAKQNAEKNLTNARELFESHLQSVFTYSGANWESTTLGKIGSVSMCKRVLKEQTTRDGEIPFFKIGTFGKNPDAFISSEIYDEFRKKYSFPKKGDVLLSAAGTIGRRVKYDGRDAYFQDSNIVWLAHDEGQVLNDYLYHFYGSCEWRPTKGATISRLYNDDLRRMKIAFPKDHEEQRRIVEVFDGLSEQVGRLESVYRRKLAALDELKKSLLHRAFSGEL